MAPIVIPADYWTIRPRGFAALIAGYRDPFRNVGVDVSDGAAPITGSVNADTVAQLATQDGDADMIAGSAFSESSAIATTPTGDAVVKYGGLDGQLGDADSKAPGELPGDNPGYNPPPPPYHPGDPIGIDDPFPPRGRGNGPGGDKGGGPSDDSGTTPPTPPTHTGGAPSASGDTTAAAPTLTTESGAPIMSADTSSTSSAAPAAVQPSPAPIAPDQLPVTRAELLSAIAALDLTVHVVV